MVRLLKLIPCLALAACIGGGGSSPDSRIDTAVVGNPIFYYAGLRERGRASCAGAVCTLIVAGESVPIDFRENDPRDLDAVQVTNRQTRNGVFVALVTARGTSDDQAIGLRGYGAWATHGASFSATGSVFDPTLGSLALVMPMSGGIGARTNPVSGSATWAGAMVGNRIGARSVGAEVIGDAELRVRFPTATLDVGFTNVSEVVSGAPLAGMRWNAVPMIGGEFEAAGLSGRFYGPGHEEAGGVFERNQIAGAFHTVRN